MVFQSYALWPHMTVRKNIAYPLRARGLKHGLKGGWVEETAKLVDCGQLLDRYPAQLSGGQQQRVALARGLVARPDLVLFDEPLSNLDARLRDQVRAEIHELHGRLGFTAVFVTHDQSEALALGDRLAIMRDGRIEQYDTPEHVFEHPATEYVAEFIGMSNRLVCEHHDGGWACDGQVFGGAPLQASPLGGVVAARLRSVDIHLHPRRRPAARRSRHCPCRRGRRRVRRPAHGCRRSARPRPGSSLACRPMSTAAGPAGSHAGDPVIDRRSARRTPCCTRPSRSVPLRPRPPTMSRP